MGEPLTRAVRGGAFGPALFLTLAFACKQRDADPRPQLVVVLDTDAPLVGQLGTLTDRAEVAAIDAVRVDIVRDDRSVVDFRDFTAPDARDWPLSFGVVSEDGAPSIVRLRVRAFREASARSGILDGQTALDPAPSRTIDRIVEIALPASGLAYARVTLSMACLGAAARFETPFRTCIDDAHRDGAPADGVASDWDAPTRAGGAPIAQDAPCTSEPPDGAACVPGGMSVLGDTQMAGLIENIYAIDTSPERPVRVSPFHMDLTEMTVGRYRKLLNAGKVKEAPLTIDSSLSAGAVSHCTWISKTSAANDALPLNCITHDGATQACAALSGRLPTEAEWEHAARGRGEGRRYPWGNQVAACCSAAIARSDGNPTHPHVCDGTATDPVGTHGDPATCDGPVDVSRDGILDLGGNLSEMTLDEGVAYADPCWSGPGVIVNPRCKSETFKAGTFSRGGNWLDGRTVAASPFRDQIHSPGQTVGFRCVYDDAQ